MDRAWLDLSTRRSAAPPRELSERFEGLVQTEGFQQIAVAQGK